MQIKPIHIGPIEIECPVILAPMTGVTDMPFRRIVRRFGSGLNVTEMIASQAMIRETRQSLQKCAWDAIEEPVSMQLAGCTPYEMGEAAKLNEERGAAIIDINMGCPGEEGRERRCRFGVDARFAAGGQFDRRDGQGGVRASHGEDADGLGSCQPERARTRAYCRGSGRKDDYRARSDTQPDVQGLGRLGICA